jgi:uncharacterized phiE125 gp8 family phage protein
MVYRRITDAGSEPLTLDEVKLHLRVDLTDDDTLITRLISAARRICENYTERSFITQTWKASIDSFPDVVELLHGPVSAVSAISYTDIDGNTQTMDASDYILDLENVIARITPATSWPSTQNIINAVSVTYTAGFGSSASNVPDDIKAAMLLIIGKMYDQREDSVLKLPSASEYLLDPYKIYATIK